MNLAEGIQDVILTATLVTLYIVHKFYISSKKTGHKALRVFV